MSGRAVTDATTFTAYPDALVVQADGRILAFGNNGSSESSARGWIARFTADGAPDRPFGTGGFLDGAYRTTGAVARDLLLQPNGKMAMSSRPG